MSQKKAAVRPFNFNMDRATRQHLKQMISHARIPHSVTSAIREVCRRYVGLLCKQLEAEAAGRRIYLVSRGPDGLEESLGELDCRL